MNLGLFGDLSPARSAGLWAQIRTEAEAATEALPEDLRSALGRWQGFYERRIDSLLYARPGELFRAYARVRALLARLGPTARLYRGEAPGPREARPFLSWTEYRPEAEEYAARGFLRIADVPIGRILAVLPHGKGMEFLVTVGPIAGERQRAGLISAYIDVDGELDYDTGWAPGDRGPAERAIRALRGIVDGFRPRRANDEDYWSGYPPAPGHGILYFRISAVGFEALKRAGFDVWVRR